MPKLFRIWRSDGNDRWEEARVKANDIEQVIEWIKRHYFKPEYISTLNEDIADDTAGYISWDDCDECADKDTEECDSCETSTFYFEAVEETEPAGWEWQFKTIYGTNEYYDLTAEPPVKAEDWDPELAATWRRNPQEGCDLLTKKTLQAIEKGEKLTE